MTDRICVCVCVVAECCEIIWSRPQRDWMFLQSRPWKPRSPPQFEGHRSEVPHHQLWPQCHPQCEPKHTTRSRLEWSDWLLGGPERDQTLIKQSSKTPEETLQTDSPLQSFGSHPAPGYWWSSSGWGQPALGPEGGGWSKCQAPQWGPSSPAPDGPSEGSSALAHCCAPHPGAQGRNVHKTFSLWDAHLRAALRSILIGWWTNHT